MKKVSDLHFIYSFVFFFLLCIFMSITNMYLVRLVLCECSFFLFIKKTFISKITTGIVSIKFIYLFVLNLLIRRIFLSLYSANYVKNIQFKIFNFINIFVIFPLFSNKISYFAWICVFMCVCVFVFGGVVCKLCNFIY